MEFKESELSKLPFRVIGNINFLKEYPSLKDIPEFRLIDDLRVSFNDIFKYIVLLYTPNTPLLSVKDYSQRKIIAMEIADIPVDENHAILECSDSKVNVLIIAYLRMMKSIKWSKLCVYQDAYYNQLLKLQCGQVEPGERTKDLRENIDAFGTIIDELITDLLNGDWAPQLKYDVIQAINDLKNELRPEYIARQMMEGDDPTRKWSPYY
jgi:hypothetical protein